MITPREKQWTYKLTLLINLSLKHHRTLKLTDLNFYKDPWHLLVALILSTRSRDIKVNQWMNRYRLLIHPKRFTLLRQDMIHRWIFPFGFKFKVRALQEAAYRVLKMQDRYEFNNWANMKDWYGVGPKITKVFYNVIFSMPTIAVDTHTRQTFNKLTKENYSVRSVDRFLNLHIKKKLHKQWCHIVLVRWNKHGRWCEKEGCEYCKRIFTIFLEK